MTFIIYLSYSDGRCYYFGGWCGKGTFEPIPGHVNWDSFLDKHRARPVSESEVVETLRELHLLHGPKGFMNFHQYAWVVQPVEG